MWRNVSNRGRPESAGKRSVMVLHASHGERTAITPLIISSPYVRGFRSGFSWMATEIAFLLSLTYSYLLTSAAVLT